MPSTTPRDDFYGICATAAALILAVALGVPAAKWMSVDDTAAVVQAPTTEVTGSEASGGRW